MTGEFLAKNPEIQTQKKGMATRRDSRSHGSKIDKGNKKSTGAGLRKFSKKKFNEMKTTVCSSKT